ncbi:hypothetical protein GCM10010466_49720 [Planomonospora alba]|uniref:Uncharacterized protein n=1 Tax=Planomonospora alba TaxID=161354 RepID=A0ABP6NLZ1_9ACTN
MPRNAWVAASTAAAARSVPAAPDGVAAAVDPAGQSGLDRKPGVGMASPPPGPPGPVPSPGPGPVGDPVAAGEPVVPVSEPSGEQPVASTSTAASTRWRGPVDRIQEAER